MAYKGIAVRFMYIHGEVAAPPMPGTAMQLALNLQISGMPEASGELVNIPFTASVSSIPPGISITVRGILMVQASEDDVKRISSQVKSGSLPQDLQGVLMQYAVFEVSLIARELGIPPTIPLPMPPGQQKGTPTAI